MLPNYNTWNYYNTEDDGGDPNVYYNSDTDRFDMGSGSGDPFWSVTGYGSTGANPFGAGYYGNMFNPTGRGGGQYDLGGMNNPSNPLDLTQPRQSTTNNYSSNTTNVSAFNPAALPNQAPINATPASPTTAPQTLPSTSKTPPVLQNPIPSGPTGPQAAAPGQHGWGSTLAKIALSVLAGNPRSVAGRVYQTIQDRKKDKEKSNPATTAKDSASSLKSKMDAANAATNPYDPNSDPNTLYF